MPSFLFIGAALMSLWLMQTAPPQVPISTPDQIAEDFLHVACKNKERLSAARNLFEKMGAPASSISIEKAGGVENLIVRYAGISEDTIVIGAHYDFAELGCGAVDNWSGVVTTAHLYHSIRAFNTKKNVLFMAFGQEEKGLLGSKAITLGIGDDQISKYCAMINIDSFGLAPPFALAGSSSKSLMELAQSIADRMKIPFAKIPIIGADSDSTSFLRKKIPAVTLSGMNADWKSILHTTQDQASKVNPESVYLGYRLALSIWAGLEEAPCDAYPPDAAPSLKSKPSK